MSRPFLKHKVSLYSADKVEHMLLSEIPQQADLILQGDEVSMRLAFIVSVCQGVGLWISEGDKHDTN